MESPHLRLVVPIDAYSSQATFIINGDRHGIDALCRGVCPAWNRKPPSNDERHLNVTNSSTANCIKGTDAWLPALETWLLKNTGWFKEVKNMPIESDHDENTYSWIWINCCVQLSYNLKSEEKEVSLSVHRTIHLSVLIKCFSYLFFFYHLCNIDGSDSVIIKHQSWLKTTGSSWIRGEIKRLSNVVMSLYDTSDSSGH